MTAVGDDQFSLRDQLLGEYSTEKSKVKPPFHKSSIQLSSEKKNRTAPFNLFPVTRFISAEQNFQKALGMRAKSVAKKVNLNQIL